MDSAQVIVVGGGAAGMMSAVASAEAGAATMLLEKNEKLGKKVFITGHGRCNVTNIADRQTYEQKIFRNPRFVRSALSKFGPNDLIDFLEANKVRTKQEDSGRIFPASDKSSDVIRAFRKSLEGHGVDIRLHTTVSSITQNKDETFSVAAGGTVYRALSVVLATGGASYPSTGSTGEGMKFAVRLGHTQEPLYPGLVGLQAEKGALDLAGLTIGGSSIAIRSRGRVIAREEGDVLFTHSGLSGPAAFRAACSIAGQPMVDLTAEINLSGTSSADQIAEWLTEAAKSRGNTELKNLIAAKVPRRTASAVLDAAGIPPSKKVNQLTRDERRKLAEAITAYPVRIAGTRPLEEAIVTIGGISTKEINPSTMQSKLVPGLFFAGEMIDVSAYTGGYNLQIAFATGHAAGKAAAEYALERAHGGGERAAD